MQIRNVKRMRWVRKYWARRRCVNDLWYTSCNTEILFYSRKKDQNRNLRTQKRKVLHIYGETKRSTYSLNACESVNHYEQGFTEGSNNWGPWPNQFRSGVRTDQRYWPCTSSAVYRSCSSTYLRSKKRRYRVILDLRIWGLRQVWGQRIQTCILRTG